MAAGGAGDSPPPYHESFFSLSDTLPEDSLYDMVSRIDLNSTRSISDIVKCLIGGSKARSLQRHVKDMESQIRYGSCFENGFSFEIDIGQPYKAEQLIIGAYNFEPAWRLSNACDEQMGKGSDNRVIKYNAFAMADGFGSGLEQYHITTPETFEVHLLAF